MYLINIHYNVSNNNWMLERVTWEIVTPRKPVSTSTSPRSTFGFIMVTISHVIPLCSIYILVKACNGNPFRLFVWGYNWFGFFCSDEDILEYYLFFAVMRIFFSWCGQRGPRTSQRPPSDPSPRALTSRTPS